VSPPSCLWGSLAGEQAAQGKKKAAAHTLSDSHDVGITPALRSESLPKRAMPVCTSSNTSSNPRASQNRADAFKKPGGATRMADLALDGSMRMPAVWGFVARTTASKSPNARDRKPSTWTKPSRYFALPPARGWWQACGHEMHRQGDQAISLGRAADIVVTTRHLDRESTLQRPNWRKRGVGEARIDQRRASFSAPKSDRVGGCQSLAACSCSVDEVRMRVPSAETACLSRNRDRARPSRRKDTTLAAGECNVGPVVGRQKRRNHGNLLKIEKAKRDLYLNWENGKPASDIG